MDFRDSNPQRYRPFGHFETYPSTGNGNGHGWAPNEKRGWGAYDDDDDKRRKGSWWASILPSRNPGSSNGWSDEKLSPSTRNTSASWLDGLSGLFRSFDTSRRPSLTRSSSLTSTASASSFHTIRFVLLCGLWYMSSALSSNTGKAILDLFRYPVTLTFVQFWFVAFYCYLCASPLVGMTKIRPPTHAIIRNTLPMALFQVGGHIFSSMAIARIPVSTVHTIKALSPLFTVAAYALLFGVSYSAKTYISLLPLTAGVMLACTFDMSASNGLGLICAFGSALVFVSSNIFFKKIMPSNATHTSHKLDKINLLFYSSGLAFLLMVPVWLYSDLSSLLERWSSDVVVPSKKVYAHGVVYYFFMNGTVHFAQNIIAFAILSSTSPVTYSIASLIKRIAVICIAIAWFNQTVHPIQAFGICLTFIGLWMYNSAKADVEKGENKMRRVEAARDLMLPSTRAEQRMMEGTASPRVENEDVQTFSVSTSVTRMQPHYVSPTQAHHPHPLPPPLKTTFAKPRGSPDSPSDPYPSPPASSDSPPPSASNPFYVPPSLYNRRGTVSESQAPLLDLAPPPSMPVPVPA